MLRTILIALLALPFMAVAQDLPSADTVLWNRFHDFETRMLAQPVRTDAAAALNEYQLVWVEHNNGYFTSITAGNSTITLQSMVPEFRIQYPSGTTEDVTFHGERIAVLERNIPVAMLDLTRWFFERRNDQSPASSLVHE